MLRKVELHNFMSFEDAEFAVGDYTMLVGDNGAGKSTAIEAIPYVYWGVARVSGESLVRNSSDGDMWVRLTHEDKAGNVAVMTRGRKNGKGRLTMKINGVAEGGSIVEVEQQIATFLGMTEERYFGTSFVGMAGYRRSDVLLDVTPADRWEAMQALFGVEFYQKGSEEAAKRLAKARQEVGRQEIDWSSYERHYVEPHLLDAKLEEAKGRKASIESDLEEARVALGLLSEKVARATEVGSTVKLVVAEIAGIKSMGLSVKGNVGTHTRDIEQIESEVTTLTNIPESDFDTENTLLEIEKAAVMSEYTKHDARSNLLEVATKVDLADAVCPLCERGGLEEQTMSRWKDQYQEAIEGAARAKSRAQTIQKQLDQLSKVQNRCVARKARIEALQERLVVAQRGLKTSSEALTKLRTDMAAAVERKSKIDLSEVDDEATARSEAVQENIDTLNRGMGSALGDIRNTQQEQKDNVETKKKMVEIKQSIDKAKKTVDALEYLVKALSRYGIPAKIVEDGLSSMQELATRVYSKFDSSAEILIRVDASGARPSVDFVLSDEKGEQQYEGLSLGQKAMVGLAIRMAASRIISELSDTKVDILVLDEVMANLSPSNREALMAVALKVVKGMFPRIIMVSHVEVADVFDNLKVVCEAGVSRIE